jgi:RNA-directed DNA polymerase
VCAFQYASDAERFYKVLPKRLKMFNLDVAEEKTSLIRFSHFHVGRKRHFVFLGFEFYWGTDAKGKGRLRRRTAVEKQNVTLSEYYRWIKAKRSLKLRAWLPQLKRKLLGFSNYFGLPDNSHSLAKLYSYVLHTLYKWLNRRSGRQSYNWSDFKKMLTFFKIEAPKVSKRNVVVDWY